jgi:hypothetical protein
LNEDVLDRAARGERDRLGARRAGDSFEQGVPIS